MRKKAKLIKIMTVILIVTKINKNNPSKGNQKYRRTIKIKYKMSQKRRKNKKSNKSKNK